MAESYLASFGIQMAIGRLSGSHSLSDSRQMPERCEGLEEEGPAQNQRQASEDCAGEGQGLRESHAAEFPQNVSMRF
jgi:hypothetical protein